ncbi:hypothetical protein B0T11DRAFT_282275 [Plectosphaerella cucumerina]|uniref:BZIP domain-containing protein n=1 Tax=Plectosphaerella cucumerina TaxID=40658 RepID=A0A8K0TMR1_9PEZI|nr:hypothetical protein B0T11DRAFT_282275 [Plectosphaerella cucumerina]
MAQGDFIYPASFGLGHNSDAILSSHIQGDYPDHQHPKLYLPDQLDQSTMSDFLGYILDFFDTASMMTLANSTATMPSSFLKPVDNPFQQPPAPTEAPPKTPLPPAKRGRGRPRKHDVAQLPKTIQTSLPSPSTSQASPQSFSENHRPRGPETPESQDQTQISPPADHPESPQTTYSGGKLDRRRGRNREAAQKCRTRKQHSTQKLVTDVAAAEAINEALRKEATGLREETLLLKNMVLQHGKCDCPYIQTYIKNAASKLTAVPPPPSPGAGSTHEYTQQRGRVHGADMDDDFLYL